MGDKRRRRDPLRPLRRGVGLGLALAAAWGVSLTADLSGAWSALQRWASDSQAVVGLLAEQLGLDTVVMMSGLPGGCPEDRTPTWIVTSWPPETEEILRYQWKAAVPVWKALAARARDHGVKRIALEFHGWQLVYNVETLRRLRSEVGDDILGVNLDPSHLFWMGADPVEVARALADCIYHVHIKDVRLEPAAGQNTLLDTKGVLEFASRSWNFVTPGTGHDAAWWRRFLETLRDCGYDGPLSIEQEDYTIPLEEALDQATALLRQVLPA